MKLSSNLTTLTLCFSLLIVSACATRGPASVSRGDRVKLEKMSELSESERPWGLMPIGHGDRELPKAQTFASGRSVQEQQEALDGVLPAEEDSKVGFVLPQVTTNAEGVYSYDDLVNYYFNPMTLKAGHIQVREDIYDGEELFIQAGTMSWEAFVGAYWPKFREMNKAELNASPRERAQSVANELRNRSLYSEPLFVGDQESTVGDIYWALINGSNALSGSATIDYHDGMEADGFHVSFERDYETNRTRVHW